MLTVLAPKLSLKNGLFSNNNSIRCATVCTIYIVYFKSSAK